ncbi:hypothetical protein IIQ44_03740 [Acinetobacter oleivorans]|uniref:hypothetical protein n=1 Tax=Acinetobacter oleivorans TaxID=1148157 RepID=UPI00178C9759|nr:hypothetical protein [Acinetobacter oleivorans]MBE2171017.1 hypothetical protein [Acinetobacter oleivorans]
MPQGLEVYDANGKLVIGIDSKLTRYIGQITLTKDDYTEHVIKSDGFLTGTPFYSIDNNTYSTIPIRWEFFHGTWDTKNSGYFYSNAGIAVNTNRVEVSIVGDTLRIKQVLNSSATSFLIDGGVTIKYGVM